MNAKAVHSRGCNCRKSNCLKNYCECFEARVQCNPLCRCQNCYNCESHQKDSALRSAEGNENSNRKDKRSKISTKSKVIPEKPPILNSPQKWERKVDPSESFNIENLTKFDQTHVPKPEETPLPPRINMNTKFLSQLSAVNLPLAALLMCQTHQWNYQKTSPIIEISRNSSCSSATNNQDEQILDFQSSSTSSCVTSNEISSSKRKKNKPVKLFSREASTENLLELDVKQGENHFPKPKSTFSRKSRYKRLLNENKNLHKIIKSLQLALRRKSIINRTMIFERYKKSQSKIHYL